MLTVVKHEVYLVLLLTFVLCSIIYYYRFSILMYLFFVILNLLFLLNQIHSTRICFELVVVATSFSDAILLEVLLFFFSILC